MVEEAKEPETPKLCRGYGAGIVSLMFAGLAILMAWLAVKTDYPRSGIDGQDSAGSLASILLFGVLTFFFALAALIALFRALGLTVKNAALGMPQGSVRAFMALVLIMLFFLMSVFLYLDVARTSTERSLTNLDEERYKAVLEQGQVVSAYNYEVPDPTNADSTVPRWDVVLRAARERSQVAEEMARQLITVLGTLIVAVAAFYFGANSVQQARAREEQATGDKEGPSAMPLTLPGWQPRPR